MGVKAYCRSFSESVSVIGCKNILDENRSVVTRLIWLALIISGTIGMMLLIVNRIQYYLSNPVSVDIKVINAEELPFPSVTICTQNQYSKTYLNELNLTEEIVGFLLWEFYYVNSYRMYFHTNEDDDPNKYNYNDFNNNGYLKAPSDWIRSQAALHLINNTISSYVDVHQKHKPLCFFKSKFCTETMWQVVWNRHGLCLRFNPSGDLYVSGTGWRHGLLLYLDMQPAENIFSLYKGVMVAIHQPEDEVDMETESIPILPGYRINIGMTLAQVSMLPGRGSCDGRADLQLRPHLEYSRSRCQSECLARFILSKCNCTPIEYHDIPSMNVSCVYLRDQICTSVAYETFVEQTIKHCYCPSRCKFTTFGLETSSGQLSMDGIYIERRELSTMNSSTFYERYATIGIFYKYLTYEETIQQEAYTFWSLLSDIGGALGLFTGSALFTLLELFEFLLRLTIRQSTSTDARL